MNDRIIIAVLAVSGAFMIGMWYGKGIEAGAYERQVRQLPDACRVAWDDGGRALNSAYERPPLAERP